MIMNKTIVIPLQKQTEQKIFFQSKQDFNLDR